MCGPRPLLHHLCGRKPQSETTVQNHKDTVIRVWFETLWFFAVVSLRGFIPQSDGYAVFRGYSLLLLVWVTALLHYVVRIKCW